ncbi:MAG: hypothetical protein ACREPM_20320 [Gemmatimonadaceae bacterium]
MQRRDFLNSVATTSLFAALPLPAPLAGAERRGTATPIDDTWDLSWVGRLNGKSRAVFDSPQVDEGGALFRAVLWRQQHAKVFGTPLAELTPVLVFRHEAIPLVMDDEHWDHIGVGKDLKLKDPSTKRWARRNIFAAALPTDPPEAKDFTIAAFLASGGIILACNLAFELVTQQWKDKDKVSDDEARTRAKAHLLPGIILQPSGFFAVLKAQDEGCKYMMGS